MLLFAVIRRLFVTFCFYKLLGIIGFILLGPFGPRHTGCLSRDRLFVLLLLVLQLLSRLILLMMTLLWRWW